MTKDQLIDAFDSIDSRYILSAARRIETARVVPLRRNVIRTVLIAAAITTLLAASAYAAGLFGLTARRIAPELPAELSAVLSETDAEKMEKVRETHRHSYISLGGVTGSQEYSAAAEWLSWRAAHEEEMAEKQLEKGETYYEWRDLERSFAENDEERSVARLYGCWDRASLDKLREIADAHGLKLHTARSRSFLENQSRSGTYENGSTVREYYLSDGNAKHRYVVYTELAGYLPAEELTASARDEYEEWSYTTVTGEAVSIATIELIRYGTSVPVSAQYRCLIFWNNENAAVTVSTMWSGHPDDAEGRQSFAERLADQIEFQTCAKGEQP